jgi:transposase
VGKRQHVTVRYFRVRAFSASTPEETMSYIVAGIEVHKKVLAVAVAEAGPLDPEFECRRFGTTASELQHLAAWLAKRAVVDVVMESTAQYWKPVWLALESDFDLHLAQAYSNRAPRGRKTDFRDAQRLVRGFTSGALHRSFVPDAEQRTMRTLTRRRVQLIRDRIRLQSQLECVLEEARLKLSSVLSDLLGASGRRILSELARGESDPKILAALADGRLKCTRAQLQDALTGSVETAHRELLGMYLDQLAFLERQIERVSILAAETMRPCQEAITRLCQVPGIRVIAAQQIIAEVGPTAAAFPTAQQLSSWVGTCPGRQESAGENESGCCPKGNRYLRRVLYQAAQAAVKTNNGSFQVLFRRLRPRLGYTKAIWAVARHLTIVIWKILHAGERYQERGEPTTPQAIQRRAHRLLQQLRKLGFDVDFKTDVCPILAG